MTDRTTTAQPSRMQAVATAMAASVFLLPVVVGKLLELVLKGTNPDGVLSPDPGNISGGRPAEMFPK